MKKLWIFLCLCSSVFALNNLPIKKPKTYMISGTVGDPAAFTVTNAGGPITIHGIYEYAVYTSESNCDGFSAGGQSAGFYTPGISLLNGDSLTIGENALYSSIWNTYSYNEEFTLPGTNQSIKLYIIDNYPSAPNQPNNTSYPVSHTGDPTNICININCNSTTLTCQLANTDDSLTFNLPAAYPTKRKN
jgi:hypothetical protein